MQNTTYEQTKQAEPAEALEALIEVHGIGRVVELLAEVCDEKSNHVAEMSSPKHSSIETAAELERVKQQLVDSEEAVQILAKGGAEYRQQRDELLAALKVARGWMRYVRLPCGEYSVKPLERAEAQADAAIALAEGRA